ncbi:MAG: hypothetical protein KDD48_05435, partial [Bdellovibrionales bacterium]|nr:hypothetical protein [Bdellovibrionales bacterium]
LSYGDLERSDGASRQLPKFISVFQPLFNLLYLKAKFPKVKAIQLSATGNKHTVNQQGIIFLPARLFLRNLV